MHKKSNKGSPKEELNKDAAVADSTSDDSSSSDGDVDKYGSCSKLMKILKLSED